MLPSGFYNMDCLDAMREFPDKFFDLCLTDPPNGVNLEYGTYVDTEENWYDLMEKAVPEMLRISRMVIFPSCQIKRLGWFYRSFPPDWIIAWNKGSTGANSFIGFNDWEPLLVYGKTKKQLYMHDVVSITPNEKLGNYGHPCPKPVELMKWIIQRATDVGQSAIDPFTGSGTTGIACHRLGRIFTGFELDADYYKAASERIAKEKAQQILFSPEEIYKPQQQGLEFDE